MPSAEDLTFKLTWSIWGFSTSVALRNNFQEGPSFHKIPMNAIDDIEWQVKICPCTSDGWVACLFARNPQEDEAVDVSFAYTISILGKDGEMCMNLTDTVLDFAPFTWLLIDVVPVEELMKEEISNDCLNFVIEIRRLKPDGLVDPRRTLWDDELKILSSDMRMLLIGRYRVDFKLVTDDGCQIDTHAFMLSARWRVLALVLRENPDQTEFIVSHVPGSVLAKFVEYLYTGEIPRSEMTTELFDLVVKHKSKDRDKFHTPFHSISIRTRQIKDRLSFTWILDDVGGDITDFFRVLPLRNLIGMDLLVDISKDVMDESKLVIFFSLWGMRREYSVHFQCSATLYCNDDPVMSISASSFLHITRIWRFPDFLPLSLLTDGPARRRVEFEVEISDTFANRIETTVTEFHTGSRDLKSALLLSMDLHAFFAVRSRHSDVTVRTADAVLYSCSAALGVRSKMLQDWMRNQALDHQHVLSFPWANAQTVGSLLTYLHTGWTSVSSPHEAILIHDIAEELALTRLMEKCKQCLRFWKSPAGFVSF